TRLEQTPQNAAELEENRRRIQPARQMLRTHLLQELQHHGGAPADVAQRLAMYDVWERAARQMTEIAGLLWKPQVQGEDVEKDLTDQSADEPVVSTGTL